MVSKLTSKPNTSKLNALISTPMHYLRAAIALAAISLTTTNANAQEPQREQTYQCIRKNICGDPSGFGRSVRANFAFANERSFELSNGWYLKGMFGLIGGLNQGRIFNIQSSPEYGLHIAYTWDNDYFGDFQAEHIQFTPLFADEDVEETFNYSNYTLGAGWHNVDGQPITAGALQVWRLFGGLREYPIKGRSPEFQAGLSYDGMYNGFTLGVEARYINIDTDLKDRFEGRASFGYTHPGWSVEAELFSAAPWGTSEFGGMLNLSVLLAKGQFQTTLGGYANHPLYANRDADSVGVPHGMNIEGLYIYRKTQTTQTPPQEQRPGRQMTVARDTNATQIKGWLETCSTRCQITVPISQIGTLQAALKDNDIYNTLRTQKTILIVNFEGNDTNDEQLNAIKELLLNCVHVATEQPAQNTDNISIANKHKITQDERLNLLGIRLTETEQYYSQILANTGDTYPQLIQVGDRYQIKYGAGDEKVVPVQNALFLKGILYKIKQIPSDERGGDGTAACDLQVQQLLNETGVVTTIDPFSAGDGPSFPNLDNHKTAIQNLVVVIDKAPQGVTISHEAGQGWTGVIITGANAAPRDDGKPYHLEPLTHCTAADADYDQGESKLTVNYYSGVSGRGATRDCPRIPSTVVITFPSPE